jgi:hypothetical protein
VKRPDGLGLQSERTLSCQLLVGQVDRLDVLVSRPDEILTDFYPFLCFLCHPHTTVFLLVYHVMLCVYLENFSRDFGILCISLLIPCFCCVFLVLLSFCAF